MLNLNIELLSIQNCKKLNVCQVSHPIYDILLCQPDLRYFGSTHELCLFRQKPGPTRPWVLTRQLMAGLPAAGSHAGVSVVWAAAREPSGSTLGHCQTCCVAGSTPGQCHQLRGRILRPHDSQQMLWVRSSGIFQNCLWISPIFA